MTQKAEYENNTDIENFNKEECYSNTVIKYCATPKNIGQIDSPDGAAYEKGLCGDSIGIHIKVFNNTISEAKFHTNGCVATIACGEAATIISRNKKIGDILKISPDDIINHLEWLPEVNTHCAILAATTLHKAVASYLLTKDID